MSECPKCGKRICSHQPTKVVIYAVLIVVVITMLGVLAPIVRDEIDWKHARRDNSEMSYLEYSKQHSGGRHLDEALLLGADLGWKAIPSGGDVSAYRRYLQRYPSSRYASQARKRVEECSWEQAGKLRTITGYDTYISDNSKGSHVQQAKNMISSLAADKKIYAAALAVGTKEALSDFLSDYPGHINEKDARVELGELNQFRDGGSKKGTFVAVRALISVTRDGYIRPMVLFNNVAFVYIRLGDGSALMTSCRARTLRALNEGALVEIRPRTDGSLGVYRVLNNRRIKQHSKSGVFRLIRGSGDTIRLEEAPGQVAFKIADECAISLEEVSLQDKF